MAPLRQYLRFLGYDARGWGLGTHHGYPERDAARLVPLVTRAAEQAGQPISLVGWSLGGVIVREVARHAPDVVSQVIVFGSPLIGGPLYTGSAGSVTSERQQQILDHIAAVEAATPQTIPITVIYSRRDAVVNWRAALDRTSLDASHIEVASTHLTLGVDPDVWEIVARRLAGERVAAAPGRYAA